VKKSIDTELNDFDWSPDSKWIAYADNDKNQFGVIYLYNTEDGKSYPVTDNWYESGDPYFSPDGKYLYFLSSRDFNPTYSRTEWNHSYSNMDKVYLVTLAKDTPSPFAPENDEVETEEAETTDNGNGNNKEKDKENGDEPEEKSTEIDTEGLNSRILSLPIKASNYFSIESAGDNVYYIERSSFGGPMTAKVFSLKSKKETDLGPGIIFTISANGKKMLVIQEGKYAVIDLPQGKVSLDETIDLSDLKVMTDYPKEWRQIFDESWRHMRDFFYVENMHGVDWEAMHAKYEVLLPYVNHRYDLTYIIGEMLAELSVGHTYVNSPDGVGVPERIQLGLLGAKLSRHSSGYYQVDKLLEGANWSDALRSPLTEVGVNISEGDLLLAINGKSTKDMDDIYAALVNTAGKTVELTTNAEPQMEGSRKSLIKPIADESSLYYYNWVQDNIRKVNEATGGQIGYIHIPDMGSGGLNEFVKYFYPQLKNKKGLIIDDRGNAGGNVSPMIIERLRRELTHVRNMRGRPYGDTQRPYMALGPKVMLINYASASDGDLFPYQFKTLKLGTIIGTRTWGGVVGIRGTLPFIDGGDMRRPEVATYSATESKWVIEGIGVEPDIYLDNDPAREYDGEDDQLNKAIEVILEQLDQYQPLPPVPADPDKSK
jgi:tricorn protease